MIVPVVPKPTVESTVMTEAPIETSVIDFFFPVTSKFPVINSSSSNPTKRSKIK